MRNPFVGLRPFATDEKDVFFGRDREIAVLDNLVRTLPILVVYAPSGTGKSSVVNAGLAPLLLADPDVVVVTITDPRDDVHESTSSALSAHDWHPATDSAPGSWVDMLQDHYDQTGRRVVIVLDQFEERISRHRDLTDLHDELARLANASTDAATVVLSLREDYLGDLEPLMRRVPGLLDASYRIPTLARTELEAAVYGPLKAFGGDVSAEKPLVDKVLTDLERQPNSDERSDARFEAGYFQVVWSRLWNEDADSPGNRLTLATYDRLGGASTILESFVTELLGRLLPSEAEALAAMIRYLVLPTGAKIALTIDDLVGLINRSDLTRVGRLLYQDELTERLRPQIESVFELLTRSDAPLFRRAVRQDREEFELIHDLLGRTLLDWRSRYESTLPYRFDLTDKYLYGNDDTPPPDAATSARARADLAEAMTRFEALPERSRPGPDPRIDGLAQLLEESDELIEAIRVCTEDPRNSSLFHRLSDKLTEKLPSGADALAGSGDRARDALRQRVLLTYMPIRDFAQQARYTRHRSRNRPARSRVSRILYPTVLMVFGLVAAIGATLVAELLLRSPLNDLGVVYRALTLSIVDLVAAAIYAASLDTKYKSNAGPQFVMSATTSVRSVLFPGRRADGPSKWLANIVGWWPAPFLLVDLGGLGGASLFDQLGFATTAGYNVGVLGASLLVGSWLGYITQA